MGTVVIDEAGIYLTRDGREIEILGKARSKRPYDRQWVGLDNRDCCVRYPEDGKWLNDHEECEHDIVAKKTVQKVLEGLVNICKNGWDWMETSTPAAVYPTRIDADNSNTSKNRIACVKISITYTEGEGLS